MLSQESSYIGSSLFHYFLFFTSVCVSLLRQILNIFARKAKTWRNMWNRFISVGKPLQGLKSQHILKKNSFIDKLSTVFLPRSDYTRNFSFSNLAAVVFAYFINSWLIINWFFPFAQRYSNVNKSFRNQ